MRPLLTLVLGIIWLMLASWCFAGVDQPSLVTDPNLITVINTTGDDVFATTNLTTLLDPTGNGTQHYGPYASGSTDSGTCGSDWANDTFDRHFTVTKNPNGTFLVVEQFKDFLLALTIHRMPLPKALPELVGPFLVWIIAKRGPSS